MPALDIHSNEERHRFDLRDNTDQTRMFIKVKIPVQVLFNSDLHWSRCQWVTLRGVGQHPLTCCSMTASAGNATNRESATLNQTISKNSKQ